MAMPDDCRSHATEPTGVSRQRAGQGVQLHGIIVHGPNGTVYDLSSAFNPDVDEYGTSVPPILRQRQPVHTAWHW